jgi:hypothetical protein
MKPWVGFLVLIIVILIVFFVAAYISTNRTPQPVQVLGNCGTTDRVCANGLVCQSGICKVPIGGVCTSDADCVDGSTGCIGGVCMANSNLIPINGGQTGTIVCSSNSDCPSGLSCGMSTVVIVTTNVTPTSASTSMPSNPIWMSANSSVLDTAILKQQNYAVLSNGDIQIPGTSPIVTKKNNVKLTSIFSAAGVLHGISDDQLYFLKTSNLESNSWNWEVVSWFPYCFIEIANSSLDGNYVVIYVRYESKKNRCESYRYRYFLFYTLEGCEPQLIRKGKSNKFRILGKDENSFLEICPSSNSASIFIDGSEKRNLSNVATGALLSDGSAYVLSPENVSAGKNVSVGFLNSKQSFLLLSKRTCVSN